MNGIKHVVITALSLLTVGGSLVANSEARTMHQTMDENRDGVVSEAEYMKVWNLSFGRMDQSGDHQLESSETPASVMKLADENQDGRVSLVEHRALRQRHFDSFDKDADQVLTLDEMLRQSAATGSNLDSKYALHRTKVEALANSTDAPKMHLAEGFDSTDALAAIYYEGLDWKGQPTKVFGWLGMC